MPLVISRRVYQVVVPDKVLFFILLVLLGMIEKNGYHGISSRENPQETAVFTTKYRGCPLGFAAKAISFEVSFLT